MNEADKSPLDEQEWASLAADWQQQPIRQIDTQALLRKIKRRSWVIWLTSMLDVAGVAIGFLMTFWVLIYAPQDRDMGLLMLLLCLWGTAMVWQEFRIRKGTWRLGDEGNVSVLAFSIKRCEAAIAVGRFFTPALMSALLLLWLWCGLIYFVFDRLHLVLTLSASGFCLPVWLASRFFIGHKQQELAKLKAMVPDD